jgi:hypothetical protein
MDVAATALAASGALVSPSVAWWSAIAVLLLAGSAGLTRVRHRPERRPERRRPARPARPVRRRR